MENVPRNAKQGPAEILGGGPKVHRVVQTYIPAHMLDRFCSAGKQEARQGARTQEGRLMWKAALAPAEVLVGVASFGRECIVGSCIVKIIWITTKLQISKE